MDYLTRPITQTFLK